MSKEASVKASRKRLEVRERRKFVRFGNLYINPDQVTIFSTFDPESSGFTFLTLAGEDTIELEFPIDEVVAMLEGEDAS